MAVKRDRLASNLCNVTLEYVIRHLLVQVLSMIFYKPVQLTGKTDNLNIIGRTKRAISAVYITDRGNKQHSSTSMSKKTKAMVAEDGGEGGRPEGGGRAE
jgi:hypothetical protein